MADTMINCSISVKLSNWTQTLTAPSSTAVGGPDYLGPIYGTGSASYATLAFPTISKPTDVSISDLGPMLETFTTTEDPYEYDIHIRETGGCSFEIYDTLDTTNGTSSSGLLWGSTNLPRGCTNSVAGDVEYNAFDDSNGGTAATDLVGYTVILEWAVGSNYRFIKMANCKLKATPAPSPQRATRLRVELSDARLITLGDSGSSLLT